MMNEGGDDGTMIMIMLMVCIVCCCCCVCGSSILTAYANDGCDTSGTFSLLVGATGGLYRQIMGGNKLFQCNAPGGGGGAGDGDTGGGGGGDDGSGGAVGSDGENGDKKDEDKKDEDKKDKNKNKNKTVYKDNCVYLYQDKDGKKYLKTICVTRSNPKSYWENGKIHGLSSIRYGKETQVHILPRNESNTDAALKFNDGKTKAGKLVNLSSFDNQAGAISVMYKDYKGSGQLKNVGGKYDENCVYLYSNSGGKGYMQTICSKSSGIVSDSNGRLSQLSSIRVGKNATALLTKTNSSGGRTRLSVSGKGAKNVVNLSSAFNDQINNIMVYRR